MPVFSRQIARARNWWIRLCTGTTGDTPLDEEHYRQRILVTTSLFLLLTVIALTVLTNLSLNMSPEGEFAARILYLVTGVSVLLSMLVLRVWDQRILALHMLLLVFTGAFTVACIYFGGTRSPTYALLILAPVMAAIVGSVRASLFWSALVLMIWFSLLALERIGMQFEQIIKPQNYNIAIALAYLAMGIAVVSIIIVYAEMNSHLRRSLQKSNAELAHLSTHDDLTNLHNRRHFDERLEQSLQRARSLDRCLALLVFDLNDFKDINDSLGHGAGDKVLTSVATRIKACLRETDLAARLGGDEFAVVVEDVTDLEQVTSVADKLATAVLEPVEIRRQPITLSASFGIALYPIHADDREALLEMADRAMYQAKASTATVVIADG